LFLRRKRRRNRKPASLTYFKVVEGAGKDLKKIDWAFFEGKLASLDGEPGNEVYHFISGFAECGEGIGDKSRIFSQFFGIFEGHTLQRSKIFQVVNDEG
jgi:hypothetical protein